MINNFQNKAHSMVACLEFIKLNIKTQGASGVMANGKRKLSMWKHYVWKVTRISLNVAFWIFILYKLLS
ncbi:hypothetical protein UFOVP533_8 [uncultured Caudovirales phage]|uniref:Uncharacterized protein n=1 Tax=uncultured Caudovirales phage TaxID=2100421 RepID=A0A6J5MN25_9CAUD|nr:hypothetical protein UFOVP533_8 [uncultured Caudovirales phage]